MQLRVRGRPFVRVLLQASSDVYVVSEPWYHFCLSRRKATRTRRCIAHSIHVIQASACEIALRNFDQSQPRKKRKRWARVHVATLTVSQQQCNSQAERAVNLNSNSQPYELAPCLLLLLQGQEAVARFDGTTPPPQIQSNVIGFVVVLTSPSKSMGSRVRAKAKIRIRGQDCDIHHASAVGSYATSLASFCRGSMHPIKLCVAATTYSLRTVGVEVTQDQNGKTDLVKSNLSVVI
eukprot:scaffold2053_cov106-Skeletonema_dohrnii-CCMP3373.AAC.9